MVNHNNTKAMEATTWEERNLKLVDTRIMEEVAIPRLQAKDSEQLRLPWQQRLVKEDSNLMDKDTRHKWVMVRRHRP